MGDHPIIFSAPMVRALLDGRKTMTRRLAWGELVASDRPRNGWRCEGGRYRRPSPWQRVQPGDRLWVRESFTTGFEYDDNDKPIGDESQVFYAASFKCARWYDPNKDEWRDSPRWTPSIHMPRDCSRLTLIVTATKIERLQEISGADCRREGIFLDASRGRFIAKHGDDGFAPPGGARDAFEHLWRSLHGPESWAANPEVVALTFRIVRANIDSAEARTP